MSKELMREMLEFLEGGDFAYPTKLATDLREELAKPDFWEGYVPEPVGVVGSSIKSESPLGCNGPTGPAQQDSTCNNTLRAQGKAYPRTCKKCGKGPCVGLAQQALDKKAENAKELGLDYEPAQQEPVAGQPLPCPFCGHIGLDFADGETYRWGVASCGGCGATCGDVRREYPDKGEWHTEAIVEWNKRSPAAQRTWVGLTDEEVQAAVYDENNCVVDYEDYARAIEAKLKEKNNG